MRYLFICLFLPSMLLPVLAVEWLFWVSGSGLSLTDSRGPGQVTLLVLILLLVAGFVKFVAREEPLGFFMIYLRNAGRAARGLGFFFLATSLLVALGYLFLGAIGVASWSEEAWAALSLRIAERTLVALLVVLILATTEEILFRVFLMRYLRWNLSVPVTIAAVVFSSFVFAASHNLTDPLAWFTAEEFPLFVGLFILGVLLCVTYLATGNFWCAVGVHSGLLGSKVFLRRTELVDVDHTAWWMGPTYDDMRMAPTVWLIFAAMAVAIFMARHWLQPRFSIERPVVSGAHGQARHGAGAV